MCKHETGMRLHVQGAGGQGERWTMNNEITARRAIRQFTENSPERRVLLHQVRTAVQGDEIATARILAAVDAYLEDAQQGGQPWQRNERIPASWQPYVTHTRNPAAGVKGAIRQSFSGMIKRLARVQL